MTMRGLAILVALASGACATAAPATLTCGSPGVVCGDPPPPERPAQPPTSSGVQSAAAALGGLGTALQQASARPAPRRMRCRPDGFGETVCEEE